MTEFVDVCVPTLRPLSTEWEEHLKQRIPVHDVLVSHVKGRGAARQDLIQRVTTEFFVFIDDDVWLRPTWWREVTALVDSQTGAVEGLWSYARDDPRVEAYSTAMIRLTRILRRPPWTERVHRAFTGDTLIRKAAVQDIRIPPVSNYEDEFIRRHIEAKGYRWGRTSGVVCDHRRRYNIEEAYQAGRHGYYFGFLHPSDQIGRFFVSLAKASFAAAVTGRLDVAAFELTRSRRVLRGVLHAYVQRWRHE